MTKAPRKSDVSSPADRVQRICVGQIGAAHGVRGDVKLWSYTTDPLAIVDYGELQTADGSRVIEIESMRPQGEFLVAHIKGVSDRTAAEKLRNTELYVPRDRLPEIDEDGEFYVADLVGLAAVDRAGAALGTIVGVHNFGAGDLIEVRLDATRDTVLIPFNDATVPEIDIAGGRIAIDFDFAADAAPASPPEGESQ